MFKFKLGEIVCRFVCLDMHSKFLGSAKSILVIDIDIVRSTK